MILLKIIYKIKKVAVKIGQNIHAGFHQKIISINIKVTEQIQHNNHAWFYQKMILIMKKVTEQIWQNNHVWFYQKIILIIEKSSGTKTQYSCMILSKNNIDNQEKNDLDNKK